MITILLFAAAIVYLTPLREMCRLLCSSMVSLITDTNKAGCNEKEDNCYQKDLPFPQATIQLYKPYLLCRCPKVSNPVVPFSVHQLKRIPAQPPDVPYSHRF